MAEEPEEVLDEVLHGAEPLTPKFKRIKVRRGATELSGIINRATTYKMHIIGGYVRWMCSTRYDVERPGDVDLFPSEEGYDEAFVEYLLSKGFEVRYESEVAWTFKRHERLPYRLWPIVQVIKGFRDGRTVTVGTLEEIIANFDFTVVRVGLINKTYALADPDFIKDEENKRLRWRNIHCPLSAVIRACKYAKKGYSVRPMEVLRLFDDWDERGVDYKHALGELFMASQNEEEFSDEQLHELERLLRLD